MAEKFSISLRNLTGTKQTVSLFENGASGDDVPIGNSYISNGGINGDINKLSNFFRTTDTMTEASQVRWDIPDAFAQARLDLGCVTPLGIKHALPQIIWNTDDNLNQVNEDIETNLRADSNFEGLQLYIQIDFSTIGTVNEKWKIILIKSINAPNNWDVYRLRTNIASPSLDQALTLEYATYSLNGVSNNGVEVIGQNNDDYFSIQESQIGNVYEIAYIDLISDYSRGLGIREAQLLNCLKFVKRNANGNDFTYQKCPTIDTFQVQDTIKFIGLNSHADRFTLDGRTALNYSVEPFSQLRLDFNYTKLPNYVFGNQALVDEIVVEAQEKKSKLIENTKTGKEHILDIPKENEEKTFNFTGNEITKKKFNYKPLITGMVIIGLVFFLIKHNGKNK